MKKVAFLITSVLFFVNVYVVSSNNSSVKKEKYVKNEFILKLKEPVNEDVQSLNEASPTLKSLNSKFKVKTSYSIGSKKVLGKQNALIQGTILLIQFEDTADVLNVIAEYKKLEVVEFAEPNYIATYGTDFKGNYIPGDEFFQYQWGLKNTGNAISYDGNMVGNPGEDVNAVPAWDVTLGSLEVVVAVIDEGVDLSHPEFAGRLVNGYDCVNEDNDPNPLSADGHGTACAGIVAAANDGIGVVGVAPGVKIMPVKSMQGGSGSYDDIIQGIYFAADNGAHVISMSLGGSGYSVAMEEAVNYAVTNGVIVLAAAGNGNSNNQITPNYPSSYANCISVGAMSPCGLRKTPSTCDGETWWGSNYGDLDFITPGTRIYTTDITGGGGYTGDNYVASFNGTSAATPFAAGVAALALSITPNLTPGELRELMRMASVDVGDIGYDLETGYGRLDAFALLAVDDSIAPAPITDVIVSDIGVISVTLEWTATGASADSGKASFYDIRYAEFPIDSVNFDSAIKVINTLRPAMAGEMESFKVTNLQPSTQYYFAIKASDSFNYSKISNVVEATTLLAPAMAVNPATIYQELDTDQSEIRKITIHNSGPGLLKFNFPEFSGIQLSGATNESSSSSGTVAQPGQFITSISPDNGSIFPEGSIEISLQINSTGLAPDNYEEIVVLESNDPSQLYVELPVYLHVNGVPEISYNELDFGIVFVNYSKSMMLTVTNSGTDTLEVTGISSNNNSFTLVEENAQFKLYNNESRVFEVIFRPTSLDYYQGNIVINSNSQSNPVANVSLFGVGLNPPVISVSPDSLYAGLQTGDSLVQQITIDNSTGGSELVVSISSQSRQIFGIETSFGGIGELAQPLNSFASGRKPLRENLLVADAGVEKLSAQTEVLILHDDESNVSEIQGLLQAYPDLNISALNGDANVVNSDILLNYQIVIVSNNGVWSDPVNIGNALADYVDNDGKVIVTVPTFYNSFNLQGRLVDEGYLPVNTANLLGYEVLGAYDAAHPIMKDVNTISADLIHPDATLNSNSSDIARFSAGGVFVAQKNSVAAINIFLASSGFWAGDVPTLLHNAINSLSNVKWLVPETKDLTILPGTSQTINVTLNATELNGGNYDAFLNISSNDPVNPVVQVPVHLKVTGIPEIAVNTNSLDFGDVYTGYSKTYSLAVKNTGTDLLTVTGITSNNPNFTVINTSFSLNPKEEMAVDVTFSADNVVQYSGMLAISNNSASNPNLEISLSGAGLLPPVITVAPDSLYASLIGTDSLTQQLTIGNITGGSQLVTEISVVPKQVLSFSRDKTNDIIRTNRTAEEFSSIPFTTNEAVVNFSPKPLSFYDGFESGSLDEWILDSGTGTKEIVSTTAAKGKKSLHIQNTSTGHFIGVHQEFNPGSQPKYISAYIKSGSTSLADAYLVFLDQAGNEVIWFYATESGMFYVNGDVGGHDSFIYNANVWYHIEFKDIDWIDKDFDYYVDGELVKADIPMRNSGSINDIAFLNLYNFHTSEAWWDEINVGENLSWLTAENSELTVMEGTSEQTGIKMKAAGLVSGLYEADILLSSNDPANPEVRVPVSLNVTAIPDIDVSPMTIDFGEVFISVGKEELMTITNTGMDTLKIADITADVPEVTVFSDAPFVLLPGESRDLYPLFLPVSTGVIAGNIKIESNVSGKETLFISFTGEGVYPPVIEVTPDSLFAHLLTGDTTITQINIYNSNGGSALQYSITVQPKIQPLNSILNNTVFIGTEPVADDIDKTLITNDESVSFKFERNGAEMKIFGNELPLEEIKANFDISNTEIINLIPDNYSFSEGESGNSINDGGNDMYDGGNMLTTENGNYLDYTQGIINSSPVLNGGLYFTMKYPGLFVFAGDINSVNSFVILGDNGADGGGSADGSVLTIQKNGINYIGFVKRVYNAGDPSINHLIILEDNGIVSHQFSTYTNDDYHEIFNLNASSRIYYLLYAGANGKYYDDETTLAIMDKVIDIVGAGSDWLTFSEPAGSIPAGQQKNIDAKFNSTRLKEGLYEADVVFATNDPVTSELIIPASLQVSKAPDIATYPKSIEFGSILTPANAEKQLWLQNIGSDTLKVYEVTVNDAHFQVINGSFVLVPGTSAALNVTFSSGDAGNFPANISIASNDPNQPEFLVPLHAEAIFTPCNAADSLALVAIYNATNGTNWQNKTGWLTGNVQNWYGVKLNDTGRVVELNLVLNGLNGYIPIEIGTLTGLEKLHLGNNMFRNEGNYWNSLSQQPLPQTMANLINLQILSLDQLYLNGELPDMFGGMIALRELYIRDNYFTNHSFPGSITSCSSLERLQISYNGFYDLADLSDLSSLAYLEAYGCYFDFGDIEPNLWIPQFEYCCQQLLLGTPLSINPIEGETVVQTIEVGGVNNIYQWLKDGVELTNQNTNALILPNVTISDAGIYTLRVTNSIATQLVLSSHPIIIYQNQMPAFHALEALYYSTNGDNWFNKTNWLSNEPITTWYGIYVYDGLIWFDLNDNNLVGTFPVEFGDLTPFYQIAIQNNQGLTGEIPSTIGQLSNLNRLYLSNNNLTGSIPSEILSCSNLTGISIINNQISGMPDFGGMSSLDWIEIQNNKLEFDDIIPSTGNPFYFGYSPQKSYGELVIKTLVVGESVTFNGIAGGDGNQYQWYKNDQPMDGQTGSELVFNSLTTDDEGTYVCRVTNQAAPNLVLVSETKSLVDPSKQDAYEPDNSFAYAQEISGADYQQRSLFPAGDRDIAWFEITQPSQVQIWFSNGEWGSRQLTAYSTDTTTVLASGSDYCTFITLVPGIYYVKAWSQNSEIVSEYFLDIEITPFSIDAYEPDNSWTDAKQIYPFFAQDDHNLKPVGDTDYVKFEITDAPRTITADVFDENECRQFGVWLYGTDGTSELAYSESGAQNCGARLQFTIPENGTYYLKTKVPWQQMYDYYTISVVTDGQPPVITCNPQDSLALVTIYNVTNGPNWGDKTNWLTGNVQDWYGVTLNIEGRVTGLNLACNNLSGYIPTEIGNLTELKKLHLGNNMFVTNWYGSNSLSQQPIPQTMANLTKLEVLSLDQLWMNSELPDVFGGMTELRELYIQYNYFNNHSLPAGIASCSRLERMSIYYNYFYDLPDLSGLNNLIYLEAGRCYFDFEDIEPNLFIPQFYYYNQRLILGEPVTLNPATSDTVTHTIEVGGTFNNYQWLKDGVELNGQNTNTLVLPNISAGDAGIYTLRVTNSQATQLTLTSHPVIIYQNQLPIYKALEALYNSTGGVNWNNKTNWLSNEPLTTWFGINIDTYSGLYYLNLYNNNLIGSLPQEFGDLSMFYNISIGGNLGLSGEIPATVGQLTQLQYLQLYNNNLTGSIPDEILNCTNLRGINVQDNQITGSPDLSGFNNISWVYVDYNKLEFDDIIPMIGKIPDFYYAPQKRFGQFEIHLKQPGDSLILSAIVGGTGNMYQWYKDGTPLEGETLNILGFDALTAGDFGSYTCQVTNPDVPNLTLESETMWIIDSNLVDAYEPDNSIETASTILSGNAQEHNIYPVGDVDYASFEILSPSQVEISFTTESGGRQIQLIAPDGSTVLAQSWNYINTNLNQPGTYYIRAWNPENQLTVSYQLGLNVTQLILVTSIDIHDGNITSNNGTLQMVADILPVDADNQALNWTVENGTGRATIDNNGLLTAILNGTVTVKAKATDGSGAEGTALVTISGQVSEFEDFNIVRNGRFDWVNESDGMPIFWGTWVDGISYGDVPVVNDGVAVLASTGSHPSENWHYQFNQSNLTGLPDIPYVVSFIAWGDNERNICFDFEDTSENNYNRYGISSDPESNGRSEWTFPITTTPTRYTFHVTFDQILNNTVQKIQWMLSQATGTVYLDSVSVISEADLLLLQKMPLANAGSDQQIMEGELVTLDGTASINPEAGTLTYLWTAPEGITLSSDTAAQPVFTAPNVSDDTDYIFTLVVNNGIADSYPDSVVVTVLNKTVICATLRFRTGWNIFSVPNNPDVSDLNPTFQPMIDNTSLVKIQDELGNSFENWGIFGGWQNNIGNIESTEGYKIKVAFDDLIEVCGSPIEYPFAIPLKAGWNIIGYPQITAFNGEDVVQELITQGTLVKVQDETGNSIENWGIFGGWQNNIGNFIPGEGYKIKLSEADTLWINNAYPKSNAILPELIATRHFVTAHDGNGVDHMNINLVGLHNSVMQAGDELAVFDGEICVGAITLMPYHLKKQAVAIIASATDNQGMPGFIEGGEFSLKLWSSQNNREYNLEPEIVKGSSTFTKHETTIASLEKYTTGLEGITGLNSSGINCYPNPFSNEVTIEINLATETQVEVEVLNQVGQRVKFITTKQLLPEGIHKLSWNGHNANNQEVSPGVYHVRVNTDGINTYKKIVFSK
ncbi:MAG: S8 family serine peptidase [Draconibacterium sp.]